VMREDILDEEILTRIKDVLTPWDLVELLDLSLEDIVYSFPFEVRESWEEILVELGENKEEEDEEIEHPEDFN